MTNSAVERHPCGVCVNLLPYIGAPYATNTYWKEIFKQIMHSMGMNMVSSLLCRCVFILVKSF